MATISWPAALPQTPTYAGYVESPESATVRTPMDAGPAKVRRRFTAVPYRMQLRYVMTETQLTAASPDGFKAFWETDTSHGSAEWQLPEDPKLRNAVAIDVRFIGEPQWKPLGGTLYEVTFVVEVLP